MFFLPFCAEASGRACPRSGPCANAFANMGRALHSPLHRSSRLCSSLLPPPSSPVLAAVLGKSSRRLLAFAVQRKWVAATRTLLSSVAADQPAEEAMAAIDVMCVGTTGMPLLQLAVRSQQLELVQAVLEWGDAHGEGCAGFHHRPATAGDVRLGQLGGAWLRQPAWGGPRFQRCAKPLLLNAACSSTVLTGMPFPFVIQATPSSPPPPAAAA